jgi:hypothetical protein
VCVQRDEQYRDTRYSFASRHVKIERNNGIQQYPATPFEGEL